VVLLTPVLTVALAVIHPALGILLLAAVAWTLLMSRLEFDAVTVLTVFLAVLFLIPAAWVFGPLGAVGTPALVVALGASMWWWLSQLRPKAGREMARGTQPIRVLALIFLWTVAAGFVAAFSRPLSGVEQTATYRVLVGLFALIGLTLLAADAIPTRERLDILVNRMINLASVFAAIGVIQFYTDYDPATALSIPGLVLNFEVSDGLQRSVVRRVSGTALHPVEFGAVLAVMVPLALHRALHAPRNKRRFYWFRVALLGFALPLSISRTAFVVAGAAALVLARGWTWRQRFNLLAAAMVFAVAVRSTAPGVLGTIRALFLNFGRDPSVQGRTDDYDQLFRFIGERPVFGRGVGTFVPTEYFLVDNEILLTAVTIGLVGLAALVALILGSATVARQVFWHGPDSETSQLGNALAASIIGSFFSLFTYDALSFPINAGVLFVLMGVTGALWRLELRTPRPLPRQPRRRASPLSRDHEAAGAVGNRVSSMAPDR